MQMNYYSNCHILTMAWMKRNSTQKQNNVSANFANNLANTLVSYATYKGTEAGKRVSSLLREKTDK